MVTKYYLTRYATARERDQARQRFHEANKDFQTAQFWGAGVSIYQQCEVETTLMNDGETDLGIMIFAPEEMFEKLVKSMRTSELFGTRIWEDKDG